MSSELPTIADLLEDGTIELECSTFFGTRERVDWRGDGWYSLDDENVFRPGQFPTYCRIWLGGEFPQESEA